MGWPSHGLGARHLIFPSYRGDQARFRSIHFPKPDSSAVDFERVAIDDAGLTGEIVAREGERRDWHKGANRNAEEATHGQERACFRPAPSRKS